VIVPNISAFLAAGGQSKRYFEHYGAASESIFLCPYAVDVKRFRRSAQEADERERSQLRERFGVRPNQRIVMFCGKLVEWKRPLDVVRALGRIGRDDVIGVFVGDGKLRADVEREGGRHVRAVGFVNQSEIPKTLSLADVLVLSSSIEPYGMVVAEAQAVGVPAVVSDVCGCHGPGSVLRDGVSGFVYPTGDVSALAGCIERLLDDRALHARMSQAARVQAETQSQEAAANGMLDAVRYAMAQRRSA
jgi:glycosyltransferase involved in cell wall biosynthesis